MLVNKMISIFTYVRLPSTDKLEHGRSSARASEIVCGARTGEEVQKATFVSSSVDQMTRSRSCLAEQERLRTRSLQLDAKGRLGAAARLSWVCGVTQVGHVGARPPS